MMIIEAILFVVGVVGLLGGDLTLSKNFPIKGRDARIVGGIFLLPYPLAFFHFFINPFTNQLLHWMDFFPALGGIFFALFYLAITRSNLESNIPKFWMISLLPALALGIANIVLYPNLIMSSLLLNLPLDLRLHLPEFVMGFLLPVLVVFLVSFLIPLTKSMAQAFLFAIPVTIAYFYYFSFTDTILSGFLGFLYPGDTQGSVLQYSQDVLHSIWICILLFFAFSCTAYFASKLGEKAESALFKR